MSAKLGLAENWQQFSLLVIVNGFVGGMVGLERTILPQIAVSDFQISAHSALFSFIVAFGITKAFVNYYTGALSNKAGRKRLLVIGWLFALPIPFLLMFSKVWYLILFANILLGINQGLTWSSTVLMKIDLVGEKNRGLAMGINESVGYIAVGVTAFLTSLVASTYGLRPYPFLIGVFFAFSGLTISWWLVKDTSFHVRLEGKKSRKKRLDHIFWETTWKNKNLGSISQAGMVNNLNDGMMWGMFPLLLATNNFKMVEIGKLVAIYPLVWGFGQLFMGKLADHLQKKQMIFWGMLTQGLALVGISLSDQFYHFSLFSVILGLGTAAVYPTFFASISDYIHPEQRAESIGIFRLWRDLGYPVGALMTGLMADLLNLRGTMVVIALVTIGSSMIIRFRMDGNSLTDH